MLWASMREAVAGHQSEKRYPRTGMTAAAPASASMAHTTTEARRGLMAGSPVGHNDSSKQNCNNNTPRSSLFT